MRIHTQIHTQGRRALLQAHTDAYARHGQFVMRTRLSIHMQSRFSISMRTHLSIHMHSSWSAHVIQGQDIRLSQIEKNNVQLWQVQKK